MKNELTEQNEKDLCNIILNGNTVHKNITKYLRDHNLQRSSSKGGFIKDLIKRLIDKYKLHETYYITNYKNKIPFTQEEYDVIIGGLLGDTWIGFPKAAKNCCGSFIHKLEHEEYVYYKYNFLKRRCSAPAIHNKYDKRSNRQYQQAFCKIASTPLLNPIYSAFYVDGRKTVPVEYINKLSPLGIAIWFMDDGASDGSGYKFSVDCFTENEIETLQEMLLKKYNIITTKQINQNKVIHVRSVSAPTFKKLIEPYVCDCMKYKLQIRKYNKKRNL